MAIESLGPVLCAMALAATLYYYGKLSRDAQPLRLAMLDKYSELLTNEHLSDKTKKHVEFMLDNSFSMTRSLLLSIVAIPIVAIFMVFLNPASRFTKMLNDIDNPNSKRLLLDVFELHDKITFANNPILKKVVDFEMLLAAKFVVFSRKIIRGMDQRIATTEIFTEIEERTEMFNIKNIFIHQH